MRYVYCVNTVSNITVVADTDTNTLQAMPSKECGRLMSEGSGILTTSQFQRAVKAKMLRESNYRFCMHCTDVESVKGYLKSHPVHALSSLLGNSVYLNLDYCCELFKPKKCGYICLLLGYNTEGKVLINIDSTYTLRYITVGFYDSCEFAMGSELFGLGYRVAPEKGYMKISLNLMGKDSYRVLDLESMDWLNA